MHLIKIHQYYLKNSFRFYKDALHYAPEESKSTTTPRDPLARPAFNFVFLVSMTCAPTFRESTAGAHASNASEGAPAESTALKTRSAPGRALNRCRFRKSTSSLCVLSRVATMLPVLRQLLVVVLRASSTHSGQRPRLTSCSRSTNLGSLCR